MNGLPPHPSCPVQQTTATLQPFQLLYLCFGTQQVVQQDCVELEKNLELYLDGVRIDLPQLQSIVVLNIDSWGAGVKLWGKIQV